MGWVRPLKLYTEDDEPLKTMEGIRFYLTYKNDGDADIDSIAADITMGDTVRTVTLPGVEAQSEKTVEMVLTNNIGEDVPFVAVSFGDRPEEKITRSFKWMGRPDIQIGELTRIGEKDTDDKIMFRVMIHNRGTRDAGEVRVAIDKDNARYGKLVIPRMDAKTSAPVNLALQSNLKGLFKITVDARTAKDRKVGATRSFHIQL